MKKLRLATILASAVTFISSIGITQRNYKAPVIPTAAAEENIEYSKDTKGFVTRMYNVVLGRTPDQKGLQNWTNKLNSKQASASDIINGFFMSPEYLGRKKSNAEIVNDCYKAMLDRAPDAKGNANWLNKLNIGMTSQAICKGFVGSSEFKGLCSAYGIVTGNISLKYARDENYERTYFVYRLYANCLGRNPDVNGLENWCKSLKSGTTGTKIAQGFIFSKEYKSRNCSNQDFASMLYKTILGRNPDQNGIKSWTNQLNRGRSREYITNGFLFSSEFKGQCSKAGITLGNKLPCREDTAVSYHFRNSTLLNQHFDKHGSEFREEFGYKNAAEYESGASMVINNPNALYKTEAEDGDGLYYVEITNEFVVLSTDGYIRTYFRPDKGIAYFNKQ